MGLDGLSFLVSFLMERRIGIRRRFSDWTVREYPVRPPEPWRSTEGAFLVPKTIIDLFVENSYIQQRIATDRHRIDSLKVSIEEEGLRVPLLLIHDPDGKIRLKDGNHRYIAMRELEWPYMPCSLSKVDKAIRGYGRHLSDYTEIVVDLISKK